MGCGNSKATLEPESRRKINSEQTSHEQFHGLEMPGSEQTCEESLRDLIYDKVNHFAMKVTNYYKNQRPPKDDTLFIDDMFPPIYNSIISKDKNGNFTDPQESRRKDYALKEDEIEWLRAKDIFLGGKHAIFEGKIEAADLNQGSLGDCYLIAAMASMTEFPQLVLQIFRTLEVKENGCYEIVMKINGEWKIVLVDDYFPCRKGSKTPLFIHPNGSEIWSMLLEKAWAKVNKGYTNIISGWTTDVLAAFTSFPMEKIYFAKYTPEQKESLWNKIRDGDLNQFIMATSTTGDEGIKAKGLASCHAYSLISALDGTVDNMKTRLLKLRNPWGNTEWNGKWSDSSEAWTAKAKEIFNITPESRNDGSFFISYEDYVQYFNCVEFCIQSSPDASVTMKIPKSRVESNNVYELVLYSKTEVDISVIKKYYRYNRSIPPKQELITNLIVIKKENDRLVYQGSASAPVDNPTLSIDLDAGNYLIYFNVNYQTGTFDKKRKYSLYVSCSEHFDLCDKGTDDDCTLLSKIIANFCKSSSKYSKEISEKFTVCSSNAFEGTTYGFMFFWNKTGSNQLIEGTLDSMKNFFTLLNPFEGGLVLKDQSESVFIGNREKYYVAYCFWLSYTYKMTDEDSTVDYDMINKRLNVYMSSETPEDMPYDFVYNKIKFDLTNIVKVFDPIKIACDTLMANYPKEMTELLSMPPLNDNVAVKFRDKYDFSNGYYIGEWTAQGMDRHGRGRYVWNSGHVAIGHYSKNTLTGMVKEIGPDGGICEFNHDNGKRHGEGMITFINGKVSRALYDNGQFIKYL